MARYTFINRKTGNKANIKSVKTRAAARNVKADKGYTVAIYDNVTQQVVR